MDYRNNDTRYGPAPCGLRVLCLHDSNSNASKLSCRLEALGERLYEKHGIDLVYVNSPLLKLASLSPSGTGDAPSAKAMSDNDDGDVEEGQATATTSKEDDDDPAVGEDGFDPANEEAMNDYDESNPKIDPRDRVWWEEAVIDAAAHANDDIGTTNCTDDDALVENAEYKKKNDKDSKGIDDEGITQPDNDKDPSNDDDGNPSNITSPPATTNKRYIGLDASLLLLRQIWTSMPFWGVLAVGDSAAVASFLPLLPVDPFPSFGIFINGNTLLEEDDILLENWPCLHILRKDAKTSPSGPEKLIRQFGGQVHQRQGGMKSVLTKPTLNIIGKFLVQQKKLLRTSNDGSDALVQYLQNQLYIAEQEAATLVAREIAQNPPNPLMAVITPQNVGGWSGSKRRGPNEEGGGAPCPSEFLLNREKRSTTKSTANVGSGNGNGENGVNNDDDNVRGAEASRAHPSEKRKEVK